MAIHLILVDDEPLARLGIRARLRKHSDFTIIAEASSAEEALKQIRQLRPDVIFLDVEMISSSGLDLARMLEEPHRPLIIFLTGHRQYAVQAFDVKATDYLLKPFNDIRFEKTLDRIREIILFERIRGPEHRRPTGKITTQMTQFNSSFGSVAVSYGKKDAVARSNGYRLDQCGRRLYEAARSRENPSSSGAAIPVTDEIASEYVL